MHTAKKIDIFFVLWIKWINRINFNQRREDLKKIFVVSLLLMGIFLIGNAKVALAADGGCQLYQCVGKYSCGEGIESEWDECVDLCIEDGHAGAEGSWWGCTLGGKSLFSSNKNFVGSGGSTQGNLGCSITLRGKKSMTVDLFDGEGCMEQLRCVVSESCQLSY